MTDTISAPSVRVEHRADFDTTLSRSYDRHAEAVYGLAHRVTRDAQVAARLTAEVFGALEDVTDESCLAECVLTDVHRRAVRWLRSNPAPPPRATQPNDAEALAGLPSMEAAVIAAAYFDGWTTTTIAERFGLQVAQVAELMQTGLRRLAAPHAAAG